MYAVIESGGKQYRVELGNEIEVDRLDVEPGQTVQLERVLLVADGDDASIGRPIVDGAVVSASVVRQDRGDKVVVFKYKPKARRRVKKGARADLTVLRIAEIAFGGRSAAREAAAVAEEQRAQREAAEKAAEKQAAADAKLAAKLAPEKETAAGRSKAAAKSPAKPAAKSTPKTPAKPTPKAAGSRTTASRTQAGEDKSSKSSGSRGSASRGSASSRTSKDAGSSKPKKDE